MKNVVVSGFKEEDVVRIDPAYGHLLPKLNLPKRIEFRLDHVNVAVANTLRRVIMDEIPVQRMSVDPSKIITNDNMLRQEFIADRFEHIPIRFGDIGRTFTIDVTNNTPLLMIVKSESIRPNSGEAPFNKNIHLFDLNPGCSFKATLSIVTFSGVSRPTAHFSVASSVYSRPLDIEMYDQFTNKGVKSSIADPRSFLLGFTTNGECTGAYVIKTACSIIISRLESLRKMLDNFTAVNEDIHHLVIDGEGYTIGQLVMQIVNEQNPGIDNAMVTVMTSSGARVGESHGESAMFELITSDDPKRIMGDAIDQALRYFEDIKFPSYN